MATYTPEPDARGPMQDPKTDPTSALGRVGGVWAGERLQAQFQAEVAELLGRARNVRFPGAQPISFAAKHLTELKEKDYWVCEKTDGERYLLWMTQDGSSPLVYFINRRNEYYHVPHFFFPHYERPNDFLRDTILDGELVEDKYPDGHTEIIFLVFDMLIIEGRNMMDRSLDKRIGYCKNQVLKPFAEKGGRSPLKVKDKAIEFAYGLQKMFLEIIPKVKQLHGNDGLIFTCRETPYRPGTDPHILKWKPPEENTVDFLMHIVWATVDPPDPSIAPNAALMEDYDAFPTAFQLWIHIGSQHGEATYRRQDDLYVTESEWEQWKRLGKPLQDIIAECFQEEVAINGSSGVHGSNGIQHGSNGNGNGNGNGNSNGTSTANVKRWRWYRFRFDKDESNHITTFDSVIESIGDRVTQEDLLKEAGEIRDRWKRRNPPPPPPQGHVGGR